MLSSLSRSLNLSSFHSARQRGTTFTFIPYPACSSQALLLYLGLPCVYPSPPTALVVGAGNYYYQQTALPIQPFIAGCDYYLDGWHDTPCLAARVFLVSSTWMKESIFTDTHTTANHMSYVCLCFSFPFTMQLRIQKTLEEGTNKATWKSLPELGQAQTETPKGYSVDVSPWQMFTIVNGSTSAAPPQFRTKVEQKRSVEFATNKKRSLKETV